ncbi:MAG TPA: response regulator [Dehalococcoidia bacterium]|nr:response regulator [Dehalococcoidia bacterium]
MEAILLPLGYQVITARDGQETLTKVNQLSPDVILLDIMMPGMDGFEVTRRLRADDKTRTIPIVMVTALSEVADRVRALEAGADDFLTKPVDKTELIARINSSLKVKAYNDHMRNYQQTLEAEVANRTEELRQTLEKLKLASLDTICRLSCAAEYRDEDTGAHIKRMSHYAAAVADKMGLNDSFVESILYAAPMHDIGKIGIPDHILLKPGKLDPDEWEIMKQHTIIGAQILEGSDVETIRLAEVIALSHHERRDGGGYPRGLQGSEIPLAGRIVAIADVFDALTSKRPYKEPVPLEKSFSIVQQERARHFDPEVTDKFLAIKDELVAIKHRFVD